MESLRIDPILVHDTDGVPTDRRTPVVLALLDALRFCRASCLARRPGRRPGFHQIAALLRVPREPGMAISLTLYGSVDLPARPTLAVRVGISDTSPDAIPTLWPLIEQKTLGELTRLADELRYAQSRRTSVEGDVGFDKLSGGRVFACKEWLAAFALAPLTAHCAHPFRHAGDCECGTLS